MSRLGAAPAYIEVLRARARELARRDEEEVGGDAAPLLVTRVGDRRLAVDGRRVREVLPPGPVSMVPRAATALVGMRNVRGEILCVADLALLLGGARLGEPSMHSVVVLDASEPLGLLVDDVDALFEPGIPQGPAPGAPEADSGLVITAMTRDGVPVADVDAILAHPATTRAAPGRHVDGGKEAIP